MGSTQLKRIPNMSQTLMQSSDEVAGEVLSIWKEFDPVEGYAAGCDDCKGKLFIPGEETKARLLRRVEEVVPRLAQIRDETLRETAEKLLGCIRVAVDIDSPDEQILNCYLAVWYSILKGQESEPFVKELLERAVGLVESEHARWKDEEFSGETRVASVNACKSLGVILENLAGENTGVADEIKALSERVTAYKSLFDYTLPEPGGFEGLLKFFEENAGAPAPNETYPQILRDVFDYGASVEEISAHAHAMLEEELALARELAAKLSGTLGTEPDDDLKVVSSKLGERYKIVGPVIDAAKAMMGVLNRYVNANLQDLGRQPSLMPEPTPSYLESLVTSGATIALDYVRDEPLIRVYVTEDRNASWLTLLNVLVHEAAHAYHPTILYANPSVRDLEKLKTWLAIPLSEAVGFHRELELFEAVRDEARDGGPSELLEMFVATSPPMDEDVIAFEFETRMWRILRALRTICDVEVNSGITTYVDFLTWARTHTGIDKKTIHDECFTFLTSPGYTPSYSFCGSRYAELQREAAGNGFAKKAFNTKANRMGLLPWTLCLKRLGQSGSSDEG